MKGFQIHGWRRGIGTSLSPEYTGSPFEQLRLPLGDLIGMDVELLGQFGQCLLALDRGQSHFCRPRQPYSFASQGLTPEELARIPRLFESALDAGEQCPATDWLLDEVRSARLHGLNRHWHVAIAGDHDGRQPMARIT
jgi:hypothetical protein